jgi:hypothetical protein
MIISFGRYGYLKTLLIGINLLKFIICKIGLILHIFNIFENYFFTNTILSSLTILITEKLHDQILN